MDNPIFKKLDLLKNLLNRNTLNLQSIYYTINEMRTKNYKMKMDYLEDLLHPETRRGVRIPSENPVPTCTFNLTTRVIMTPNPYGNLYVWINPYFLTTSKSDGLQYPYSYVSNNVQYNRRLFTKDYSGFSFNNQVALDGQYEVAEMYSKEIGMKIEDVYTSYRLVSGSVQVRYIKDLASASGVMGGAVINNETQCISCKYYIESNQSADYDPSRVFYSSGMTPAYQYSKFDTIRHCIGSKENTILEGLRLLYYPIDNSFDEFVPIYSGGYTEPKQIDKWTIKPNVMVNEYGIKTGFNWAIYVEGASDEPNSIYMDLNLNFECIPKPEYLDYFPVGVCTSALSIQEKKEIFDIVKSNSISKINKRIIK